MHSRKPPQPLFDEVDVSATDVALIRALMKDISRRSFIVTGSGLLAGLGACSPQRATATQSDGTIRVTVTGLTGAPNGGSVQARFSDNTGSTHTRDLTVVSGA